MKKIIIFFVGLYIQACSAAPPAGIMPIVKINGRYDNAIIIHDNRGFWDFPFGKDAVF